MAAGVENAEAICCFLTPKYQDSVACKDELTYAKERGVCIIPIRLMRDWKPTGWLGFTITGHKWIDFRDFDTNMDLRTEQLIAEINMLVGDKLDCFQGMQFNLNHNEEKQHDEQDQTYSTGKYESNIHIDHISNINNQIIEVLFLCTYIDSDRKPSSKCSCALTMVSDYFHKWERPIFGRKYPDITFRQKVRHSFKSWKGLNRLIFR